MLRNKKLIVTLTSVLIIAAIYLMGCGDFQNSMGGNPSGPATVNLPPLDEVNLLTRARYGDGYNLFPDGDGGSYHTSEIITSDGGEISLEDIEIEFKKDAIGKDEEIEVTIDIPDPSIYLFDLGPDGMEFKQKVDIRVYLNNANFNGIDPNDLVYIWWDEGKGEWVEEGGNYKEKDNYIEIKTKHFSYWALASD